MGEARQARVIWEEAAETLTLQGEPVLKYTLSWPRIEDGGLGGRWISRYYARLAGRWRQRWEREVYWAACLELAARREAARPFTPWSGELTGETALLQDGVLSLRFFGAEVRGDGRPARVRWGDVWALREGAPRPLGALFPGEKGWRGRGGRGAAPGGGAQAPGLPVSGGEGLEKPPVAGHPAPGGGAPPGGGLLSGR